MSLIKRMRKQKAVYWALGSTDSGGVDADLYGKPMYATPVEIDCRWEDTSEEFLAPDGSTQMSRSVVFVDREMKLGEVLLLGELTDSVNQLDPKSNNGAWEIRRFESTPNLRNTEQLRVAYL